MPIFDFICRACGKEFETLVMGSSQPTCPKCNSSDLAKQMSTFAMRTGSRGGGEGASPAAGSGSKCSGCAGGSCSSCH